MLPPFTALFISPIVYAFHEPPFEQGQAIEAFYQRYSIIF